MWEIAIFILCSAIWSSFYTLSQVENDTVKEIIIWVGLWTTLSTWIVLILYDFIDKPKAIAWVALLTWWLGTKITSAFGEKLLNKLTDIWKKNE